MLPKDKARREAALAKVLKKEGFTLGASTSEAMVEGVKDHLAELAPNTTRNKEHRRAVLLAAVACLGQDDV